MTIKKANAKLFESEKFAVQIITQGAYEDIGSGLSEPYIVETTILRLNHIALNEWIFSHTLNSRGCYDTDEEWEAHKLEYAKKYEAWKSQIIGALGIDESKGSVCITQSLSEVFTVVCIRKKEVLKPGADYADADPLAPVT